MVLVVAQPVKSGTDAVHARDAQEGTNDKDRMHRGRQFAIRRVRRRLTKWAKENNHEVGSGGLE